MERASRYGASGSPVVLLLRFCCFRSGCYATDSSTASGSSRRIRCTQNGSSDVHNLNENGKYNRDVGYAASTFEAGSNSQCAAQFCSKHVRANANENYRAMRMRLISSRAIFEDRKAILRDFQNPDRRGYPGL